MHESRRIHGCREPRRARSCARSRPGFVSARGPSMRSLPCWRTPPAASTGVSQRRRPRSATCSPTMGGSRRTGDVGRERYHEKRGHAFSGVVHASNGNGAEQGAGMRGLRITCGICVVVIFVKFSEVVVCRPAHDVQIGSLALAQCADENQPADKHNKKHVDPFEGIAWGRRIIVLSCGAAAGIYLAIVGMTHLMHGRRLRGWVLLWGEIGR